MTDQLGLWLQNRQLVNKIDDISLAIKQPEIISLLGFRRMLLHVLKHHHDLNWIEHKEFSNILHRKEKILSSSSPVENESESDDDDDDDINSINSNHSITLTFTSLPTNIICYINTFMHVTDLAKNQRLCTTFCIINRMTSSYLNPKCDMKTLNIIPHLPQYIEWTLSNTTCTKVKGIKFIKQVCLCYKIKDIERTGIIPHIIKSVNVGNKSKSNQELQLEIMSFIQIVYDNFECMQGIMDVGAAEIFTNALKTILMGWEKSDIDYTCKLMKYITKICYKITRQGIKFRDMFIQTSMLDVIVENYKSLVVCCKMELISFIRMLFHGRPEPDWNCMNLKIKYVLLMVNELIKESINETNNDWLGELLWILCDISRNKNYLQYIIKYKSLEILSHVLCKLHKTGEHNIYKPFILLLTYLLNENNYQYMLHVTHCLLKLVCLSYDDDDDGDDGDGDNIHSYKSCKKAVENRRYFLSDHDICDVVVKMLEFSIDGMYSDIMNNCAEIMYYITKTEQNLGYSQTDFIHLLMKMFGKFDDDDELKCDILWIMQNLSTNKQSIRYVISSSIIDFALTILNQQQNNPSNYHENELKKNMVSACFLIFENLTSGTSQQFAVFCSSGFLNLDFNVFINCSEPDDKIKRNTIYCLKAVTNALYVQCKKYYQQQDDLWPCFGNIIDKDFYTDIIQFTVPKLCKLLNYIQDWSLIENIVWILSYVVIDKYWAETIVCVIMERIIGFLISFTSNESQLNDCRIINHVIRGSFIIIRRIANHSEMLAKKIVQLKFFVINLNKYLLHDDGTIITNVLQAIKSVLKVVDDIDTESKNNLFDINKGILSPLISILFFDDEHEFISNTNANYDGNKQIRIQSTLDILQILLTYNDNNVKACHNFNIAKSIAETGGLDQLSKIALSKRFLPQITMTANNVREMIVSKFITFVLSKHLVSNIETLNK